jgi:hypothetical protein
MPEADMPLICLLSLGSIHMFTTQEFNHPKGMRGMPQGVGSER